MPLADETKILKRMQVKYKNSFASGQHRPKQGRLVAVAAPVVVVVVFVIDVAVVDAQNKSLNQ